MPDDLRARILEALLTAPIARVRDDEESLALFADGSWHRHDDHKYDVHCALCRGEAETLADAVMGVVSDNGNALNAAYRERAQLVALLAAIFPSSWNYSDPDEPEWAVVYIGLPTAQCSWHVHADDMGLFRHVRRDDATRWDGHSTEEKYERIADLVALLAGAIGASDA